MTSKVCTAVRLALLVKLFNGPLKNGVGRSAFVNRDKNVSRAAVCSCHCGQKKGCVDVPELRKDCVGVLSCSLKLVCSRESHIQCTIQKVVDNE